MYVHAHAYSKVTIRSHIHSKLSYSLLTQCYIGNYTYYEFIITIIIIRGLENGNEFYGRLSLKFTHNKCCKEVQMSCKN